MALVDANYKFIFVDVGCNGRISDGGVFGNSTLYHGLEHDLLSLPSPKALPGSENVVPYHIVADEAFPLKPYLMKPFSQRGLTREKRMFNYRWSRGRRCVENAFGILANRFRVFRTPLAVHPESAEKIVMACCTLHNYLRDHTLTVTDAHDREAEGHFDGALVTLNHQGSNNYTGQASQIRDTLCDYFNGSGRLTWQDRIVV